VKIREGEMLAKERAEWLLDAVATATQDRRFLRGDPHYDAVAGDAILLNAEKAIFAAMRAVAQTEPATSAEIEIVGKSGELIRMDRVGYFDMTPMEQEAYSGLRAAQNIAHQTATDAGWYADPLTGKLVERNFGEVVALMHSELSEALEADRKGLKDDKLPHRDGREVEFADCIIRILDTAAALGLDVAGALIEKNRFNRERADHKLAARAAGGKRY
jgi:hypothetical protein